VKRVRRRVAGFTLIELMVAILIAGILMTVVGLSVRGSDRSLQFEADRVGQLLALAREEAQVRGARIRFEADASEYRFLIRRQGKWVLILDDRDLRPREWAGPTTLSLQRGDGRRVIEFGRDAVDSPFVLVLTRDGREHRILANGLGHFEVR
jgi:general secretion pathway protein H